MKLTAPFSQCDLIADRYFKGSLLKEGLKADCNTETENALYFASIKAVPLIAERHFQGYRSKKTYLR